MASIETKLLNMMAKNRKQGELDQFDTLLFNTYYNTIVGNKKVNLSSLLGTAPAQFDSTNKNKFKLKKVKWADEDSENITKVKISKQIENQDNAYKDVPSGLLKLSQLFYGNIAKFKVHSRTF